MIKFFLAVILGVIAIASVAWLGLSGWLLWELSKVVK